MYVEGKHQGHRIPFWDFSKIENNDFAEFKVYLIHRNTGHSSA